MLLKLLAALVVIILAVGSLADTSTLSPSEDEEGRLVWVGFDPDETDEELPTPSVDHRLEVVAIFELEVPDMGVTFIDCFVQVREIPWLDGEIIPVDQDGRPFVKDLDGILRPMHGIQVDEARCASPSGAVGEP